LRVAKIIGAHGLHGRLRIAVISDIIDRFEPGTILFLKFGADHREYISTEFIEQNRKSSLLKLEGINDRDEALALNGIEIYIDKADAEQTREVLGEDVFYYYDLIGCKAYWNNGLFAQVTNIMKTGGGCILVLSNNEGEEFLIPFTKSMVNTSKIGDGRIDINPVDGLFER
jgi:16S rRNA processing protein RimM